MKDSNEDLKQSLAGMTEVPFTNELRQRILERARAEEHLFRRRRRWDWKSAAAVLGGVAAVACLIVIGFSPNTLLKSSPSPQNTMGVRLPATAQNSLGSIALMKSQLEVQSISAAYNTTHQQVLVQATLRNTGVTSISASDVFGILSFQPKQDNNPLQDANWVSFVNAPKREIGPGQTVAWTFQPVGVGDPEQINQTLHPNLVFYRTRPPVRSASNSVWQGAQGLSLSHLQFHLREQWTGGASVEVRAQLDNHLKQTVQLDHILAVLWYGDDWRTTSDLRFLNHVRSLSPAQNQISPGHSAEVYFRLVGADQPIMKQQNPNIMLMTQSIGVGAGKELK